MNNCPLIVDLDGTLVKTDMLHESVFKIAGDDPLAFFLIPYWWLQGKAVLKSNLAQRFHFDPSTLPYNQPLLEWLKQQHSTGRKLILCTATDHKIAKGIFEYLGIFDELLASDGATNLSGKNKAAMLEERFGSAGFDYAGNSKVDLWVWKNARRALVVNSSANLINKVKLCCEVEQIFPVQPFKISILKPLLRIHQWSKNLLLFIPLLAAHQFTNIAYWPILLMAFFSFSLCASSVYIFNDLLDLENDRQHPRKRTRPFASGSVPTWVGAILGPLLLLASLVLARYVNGIFLSWLVFYFLLTSVYSCWLKHLVLVDCLALALLYTLRIIAGALAINLEPSFWLLAFSIFLFLSLAFVKRYVELQVHLGSGKKEIQGRAYFTSDAQLVQILGVTSGYISSLVLALYLNSTTVLQLYRTPEFIWAAVPIMLFWVSWMWMQASRSKMHDDPLVFALKDKVSLCCGVAFAVVLMLGTIGWPPW